MDPRLRKPQLRKPPRMPNKTNKTFTYQSAADDLVESPNQDYRINENHVWFRHGPVFRFFFSIAYTILFLISWFYVRFRLRARIIGEEKLKPYRGKSFFIYGNHTLTFGDVALTIVINYPRPVSAMMSQANFGIPVVGKVLEWSNMLPVPHTPAEHEGFHREMDALAKQGTAIAIYPEAHVWPYYTKIRPFSDRSFSYPARYGLPVFSSTVTYQKPRLGRFPRVTVYIDGPFLPQGLADPAMTEGLSGENAGKEGNEGGKRKQDAEAMAKRKSAEAASLRNQVASAMMDRVQLSTYEYVRYRKA